MNALSQRDTRWKNVPLGTSKTTTIGTHGCTITCIAMASGLTPVEVNQRLKSVGGYANTNLVIWSKIKEAIPNLEFEWRGYSYENNRVLKAIKNNGFCLVEVDFDGTPRTDDRHWVLYVGNKKMIDPWTGNEVSTSKYKLVAGCAIINKKQNMPEENTQLETCMKDREKFWKERDALSEENTKLIKENAKLKEKLNSIEESHTLEIIAIKQESQQDIKDETLKLKNTISELNAEISSLKEQLLDNNTSAKDRLTSRKWLGAVIGVLVPIINKSFGLNLDPAQLLMILAPLVTFICVEGFTDYKERMIRLQ